jgi:hypothetical protein
LQLEGAGENGGYQSVPTVTDLQFAILRLPFNSTDRPTAALPRLSAVLGGRVGVKFRSRRKTWFMLIDMMTGPIRVPPGDAEPDLSFLRSEEQRTPGYAPVT